MTAERSRHARASTPSYGAIAAATAVAVPPREAGLGNLSNLTKSVDPVAHLRKGASRRQRYRLQDVAGRLLPMERVRWCSKRLAGGIGGVKVNGDHGPGFSGLARCGSVWVCPICTARVSTQRAEDLKAALRCTKRPVARC